MEIKLNHSPENKTKLEHTTNFKYIKNVRSNKVIWEFQLRDETIDDLMINLFKNYQRSPKDEFVIYIESNKYLYNYGEDISEDQMMTVSLNKR